MSTFKKYMNIIQENENQVTVKYDGKEITDTVMNRIWDTVLTDLQNLKIKVKKKDKEANIVFDKDDIVKAKKSVTEPFSKKTKFNDEEVKNLADLNKKIMYLA